MILIADSGSTKCDWALIKSSGEIVEFNTMGFNPIFHDKKLIVSKLNNEPIIKKYHNEVKKIFYYGAGNASDTLRGVVKDALTQVFPMANEIHSDHDLKGAAIATYSGKTSISCILGTGANACHFDGKTLNREIPALGYILGDEASGAYFGKQLLSKYLYKQLPKKLMTTFDDKYGIDKKEIFKNVYNKSGANVYLASFMPFYNENRSEPVIKGLLEEGFSRFLKIQVMCYTDYRKVPVHFIGSIAYFFESELRKEAEKLDICIEKIIRRPIDGLIDFHRNK